MARTTRTTRSRLTPSPAPTLPDVAGQMVIIPAEYLQRLVSSMEKTQMQAERLNEAVSTLKKELVKKPFEYTREYLPPVPYYSPAVYDWKMGDMVEVKLGDSKIVSFTESWSTWPYEGYAVTEDGKCYALASNWVTLKQRKQAVWTELPSVPSEKKTRGKK